MPQLGAQSDGLVDAITSQATTLTNLTETVARGVPALRDAAENVLELNPATSSPLLSSNANDVALSFDGAQMYVLDQTGQEQRTLNAGKLTAGNGNTVLNDGGFDGQAVTAEDYVTIGTASQIFLGGDGNASAASWNAGTSRLDGNGLNAPNATTRTMNADTVTAPTINFTNANGAGIGLTGNLTAGFVGANVANFGSCTVGPFQAGDAQMNTCGANVGNFGGIVTQTFNSNGAGIAGNVFISGGCNMNTLGSNAAGIGTTNSEFTNAGILSYVALVPPPSERAMKTEQSLIDNGLEVVRALVPARWQWREQPRPLTGDGLPVDQPPDDLSVHASIYVDEVADAAPELIVHRPDDARSYDDRGLTAYLISAVQTLADRVDTLTARVAELEAAR